MGKALIGYTGFVGGTLLRAGAYDATFNSKNIEQIRGGRFDTVVCAGAKAAKWLANKDPQTDLAEIQSLIGALETVEAEHFVLISTVDVFGSRTHGDEATLPDEAGLHAYGLHRLMLEKFVTERFKRASIIRLPGLFGEGLRKNLIFDLLNGNQTELINPAGRLQWYPMRFLAETIDAIIRSGIPLIHVAPEPLLTSDIVEMFFPDAVVGAPRQPAPDYDLRTLHAELLGGADGYHFSRATVLDELERYITAERGRV